MLKVGGLLASAERSFELMNKHLHDFQNALNVHDREAQDRFRLLATAAMESYLDALMDADLILTENKR